MAKQPATIFVCQNCGAQSRKWLGQCTDCGEWNTFAEERFRAVAASKHTASAMNYRASEAYAYGAIASDEDERTTSGIEEFDRVLGGGIVAGSLVLIGGAPGIGKSTLVLQMAERLAAGGVSVLYVSGEESERQIKLRGTRLGLTADGLFIMPETNLVVLMDEIAKMRP